MKASLIGAIAVIVSSFGIAPTQAQQTATVEARTAVGGVAVTWRLARPSTEVAFLDTGIIRSRWTVTTPGVTLIDGTVRSERPIATFTILIAPDAAEVDRVYMGLVRVGTGYVLYGPGLALKGMDATLTLQTVAGQTTLPVAHAIDGYAYLGPEAAVTRETGGTVVVGASVPAALSKLLSDSFLAAQTFYGARLGPVMSHRPVLVVTTDSPGLMRFRGDVTENGVIVTRFFGAGWATPAPDEVSQLSTFVWHETFHLWNGNDIALKEGTTAPWLHEGSAEYVALVAAASSDAIGEQQARLSLTQRLNGCRAALGNRDYDPTSLRSGSAVYDCGVVIQWLADLETRTSSDGRHDVLDLWKALLHAGRAGRGYGVADFLALLRRDSGVNILLSEPGAERWLRIEERLGSLGVVLVNQPSHGDYRRAALSHVNAQNCTGGSGFYNAPEGIKLDTGDGCGILAGSPVLASVEGHDPVADAVAMFNAVQSRCAHRLPIRYTFQDNRTVDAACAAPLAAPEGWTITASPRISTRSS